MVDFGIQHKFASVEKDGFLPLILGECASSCRLGRQGQTFLLMCRGYSLKRLLAEGLAGGKKFCRKSVLFQTRPVWRMLGTVAYGITGKGSNYRGMFRVSKHAFSEDHLLSNLITTY